MITKTIPLIFLVISFIFPAHSQIEHVVSSTANDVQFEKSEWEIQLKADWQTSPYLISEVTLDMHLTSPSGDELLLPCFYECGTSGKKSYWRARFTPRESGRYSFYFQLRVANGLSHKTSTEVFDVLPSTGKGFLCPNNHWSFMFDDGSIFRGIGYNIGWECRDVDDSRYFGKLHEQARFNYASMLKQLSRSGGNLFRTWMINWNLPVDWPTVNNNSRYEDSGEFFNPSGIQRMDQMIQLCDANDVYVMLAIDAHASLNGEAWKSSKYNKLNGGPAESQREFFIDAGAKDFYKSKLRYLVARWGYSQRIAAWEFFNEVDNVIYSNELDEQIPDKIVTDWHREMADFMLAIDPFHHLITTSISHRDVDGLNDIDSISFNQRHIYRNTKDIPETITTYVNAHGKPYVIGEFSYEWDWSKNFNDFGNEMDRDFYLGLWYGLFSPTPILPLSWWWEYFEDRNTISYLRHIQNVYLAMVEDCRETPRFEEYVVQTNNEAVIAHGVSVNDRVFIYIENSSQDEQSVSLDLDVKWIGSRYDFAAEAFTSNNHPGAFFETSFLLKGNEIQIYQLFRASTVGQ